MYTAAQLISRAWYLSGIVSRGLQTVSGEEMSDGLYLLNALLDIKFSDVRLIPYFQRYAFTLNIGQEMYFIPNLIGVEDMTFNLDSVRYSMIEVSRNIYFGTGRVDNIQSLPYNYHVERVYGGCNIYVYFLPNQVYPANLTGKFGLVDVTLYQDLSLVYDAFYIEYLRYALAKMMCDEYGIDAPANLQKTLAEYKIKLLDVSPPDLSMQKFSSLQSDTGINWADVNIGRGWRP